MKLTRKRISRYLSMQKQTNDFLLKLKASGSRESLVLLSEAQHQGLQSEKNLRNLLEFLTGDGTDE